ncbi:DUF4190 domain-containing protein [Streptomyces sp. NBC_01306]|uniref:DUF4190 domain-containing protein n=1 Tax=Streptomyces sp. NBC_01306 TaxID=2903819 RepID=UPI00224E90C0|nr:DUF4190 domain-containing protein [Streptomyces sp. NBC_01306]MCX4723427.1 DUF4190 domain-containing protein [Streptomyces sp. NBC_01306]
MSDNAPRPSGDPEPPRDPWAPPGPKVPLDKQTDQPKAPSSPVHDQQTVTDLPGAGGIGQPGSVQPAPGQQTPGPHIPGQQGPGQFGSGQQSAGQQAPGPGPQGSVPPGFAPPGYPPPGSVPPPPVAPNGPGQGAPGLYGYPSYPGAAPGPQGPAAYGYPGYPGYGGQGGWNTMQQAPANGYGVAALVLGILSVVIFCAWGLGIILGTLALIFGILGRKRANRGEANNGGMALAGIILGPIGIVVSAAFLSVVIWGISQSPHTTPDYGSDGSTYPSSLIVGADH